MTRKRSSLVIFLILSVMLLGQSVLAPTNGASWDVRAGSESVPTAVTGGSWRNWSSPVQVSQSTANRAIYPDLGVSDDGQTIYLAWSDAPGASNDIYYASSSDGGWQWVAPQALFATVVDSLRPSLVLSGGVPKIAWAEFTSVNTYETRQMTVGDLAPVTVENFYTVFAIAPQMARGPGGELHIVLQGGSNPGINTTDILYSRREAGASVWSDPDVFVHQAASSYYPDIAVSADGDTVHLVWQEKFAASHSEIYYVRGVWGATEIVWGTPISLTPGVAVLVRPAIVLEEKVGSDPAVHVVWGEQVTGREEQYIRYVRSDDGGTTWGTPVRVWAESVSANNVSPTDVAPALTQTPSGALCVAWHGFPAGDLKEEEVWLSCSLDNGASWGTPINISQSPNLISIRPTLVAASDGTLHIAWQEQVAGGSPVTNYQIYYARNFPYVTLLPIIAR